MRFPGGYSPINGPQHASLWFGLDANCFDCNLRFAESSNIFHRAYLAGVLDKPAVAPFALGRSEKE